MASTKEEEEYVLLDLDNIPEDIDIPPNASYVLSGLDTFNPVMIINDKLKLIGEYEETIGTCFAFSETEKTPAHGDDSKQALDKQVEPVAGLNKILKFRLSSETSANVAIQRKCIT
jgi:general transcription factor 3C polypeptide 6